ncbi:ComEC/Rec2 family competence protein [Falsochrobactrum ovis]|uniref:ComEC/Rec2-related protein n=1 Tax=Falsochrobactrum ovis TaxID=1293442 RepID=A0A364JY15_9HYPH|nr:ComEC/Rec2 family competence protein [Falsochrobactrum ovis]RAK32354.1 ComEC/Rec2-related protein [Falsochrobactrum ovis]
MTGSCETEEIDERALVKSWPDAHTNSKIAEPWPVFLDDDEFVKPPKESKNSSRRLFDSVLAGSKSASVAFNSEIARGLFFLLFPVSAGVGAVTYFNLTFEPDWLQILSILVALIFIRVLVRKKFLLAQIFTLAIAVALGASAGKFETGRKNTPMLGSDVATLITGRVVGIEYRDNETWRVTLDVLQTEKPKLKYAPNRIRITARDLPANTRIGSGLTGYARLRVPSGPVRPGSYDFAFHAYFNGIGANGFFLGVPRLITIPEVEGITNKFLQAIAALRVRISERINEVLEGENGHVAAALIAGERAGISEKTNADLRLSGLAHILSISGLHMALAAGVVMLSLRYIFALFPAFSARYPVKKYAAFLSLLSCTFYLAMSGADVAAQRSYIMIAVMLCALLLDRAAISMRNLAIAAVAMILIYPHEVLGPSFQMSFSATAALIAAFAWWGNRMAGKKVLIENGGALKQGITAKIISPALATAGTSLVAGTASGIFAAYHFNNTAPFGIIGNVLALPVVSVLVMPFGVFSLLMMPFHLDWLPLQIMGFGIELVRRIASFVAQISPDGNPGVIPKSALLVWTVALVILVVFTSRLRLIALPLVVGGFIIFMRTPLPDILVSEDARLVAVRLNDGNFAINRNRPANFTAENWKSAYLIDRFVPPQKFNAGTETDHRVFTCEEDICTILLKDGRMLAYTSDPAKREIACNIGDVVILAISGPKPTCNAINSRVIGKQEIALKGALEMWLASSRSVSISYSDEVLPDKKRAMSASEPGQNYHYDDKLTFAVDVPIRPWHLHRLFSRPARGLAERDNRKKTAQ